MAVREISALLAAHRTIAIDTCVLICHSPEHRQP